MSLSHQLILALRLPVPSHHVSAPLPPLCLNASRCKDCLIFTLGLERKLPCRSARWPHVRRLFPFIISSRFSPLLSPSLSTRPPAQDNRERITFHPTLTASRFPAFISFLFLFPCTLGNDDRFSAAAARHSYPPEHSSIDFSSFSLTFSFIFFLQFS